MNIIDLIMQTKAAKIIPLLGFSKTVACEETKKKMMECKGVKRTISCVFTISVDLIGCGVSKCPRN